MLEHHLSLPRLSYDNLSPADVKRVLLAPSREAARQLSPVRAMLACTVAPARRSDLVRVFDWMSSTTESIQGDAAVRHLSRFAAVQEAVFDDEAEAFKIRVSYERSKQGRWGYALKIGNKQISSGRDLPYGDGCDFAQFRDCQLLLAVRQALSGRSSKLAVFFSFFRDTRLAWGHADRQRGQVPAPDADVAQKFNELAKALMHKQVDTSNDFHELPFKPEIAIHGREGYELKIGPRTVYSGTFPKPQQDSLNQFVDVVAAAVDIDFAYNLHRGPCPTTTALVRIRDGWKICPMARTLAWTA